MFLLLLITESLFSVDSERLLIMIGRFYSRCCFSGLIIYSVSHPAVPLTLDVCFYRRLLFRHIFFSKQTIYFRPPVQAAPLRRSTLLLLSWTSELCSRHSEGFLSLFYTWTSQKSGRKRTREIPLIQMFSSRLNCFLPSEDPDSSWCGSIRVVETFLWGPAPC